jgi:hypothetical protein
LQAPDPASLMLLAKTVMPSGNSAFLQKPDVRRLTSLGRLLRSRSLGN